MKRLAVLFLGLLVGAADGRSQNLLSGPQEYDTQHTSSVRSQQIGRERALSIIGQIRLLEGQRDQMQLIVNRSLELAADADRAYAEAQAQTQSGASWLRLVNVGTMALAKKNSITARETAQKGQASVQDLNQKIEELRISLKYD